MECFTANFLQLFTKKRQKLAFLWTVGTRHQTLAFPRLLKRRTFFMKIS